MTQSNIAGPGQLLPYPQNLYPTDLFNSPIDTPTNLVTLSGGDVLPIQAGAAMVELGGYALMQWLDPVTGIWRDITADRNQSQRIQSDGQNFRVANLLGCPVAAIIAGGGTSFTQATATITASVGGSTWFPIVGGALSLATISNPGKNFTIPPMLLIPTPPPSTNGLPGGVQASGYCTLSSGTVAGVTLSNVGAGYTQATVTAVILPSLNDIAAGIIPGQALFTLTDAGKITAALCTNNGAPLATVTALTLTAAGGAGSGATITPQVLQTVTLASVVAGGVGFGNATAFPLITSAGGGGQTSVSAIGNPAIELTGFRPRPFQGQGTTNAGGTIASIAAYDTGMFLSAPTPAIVTGGTLSTTLASVAFTMGTGLATVKVQPV